MSDEAREAMVSDLSHELERWFGPNLAGWPNNPTKYFGTPAHEAVERIHAAGVADGIRRARQAIEDAGPTWHRGMYGAPDDMYARITIRRAFEGLTGD